MFPDVPFSLHPRPRLSICALTPIALHTTAAVATASTLLKASGFQGSPGSYTIFVVICYTAVENEYSWQWWKQSDRPFRRL